MPSKKKTPARSSPAKALPAASVDGPLRTTLAWLESQASPKVRTGYSRYGIVAPKAFGIPMGVLQKYAKRLRPAHALAAALWETEWYEARMLATLIDDPALVTPAQMERWCRDFDNWAICDTACFCLFNQTPHAHAKITQWAGRRGEFQRRAAFALLACIARKNPAEGNAPFHRSLALIEAAATDERNFVKKGVNWALRSLGERDAEMHLAAVALAQRLAESPAAAPRWIGKDALRQLKSPAVQARLKKRSAAKK